VSSDAAEANDLAAELGLGNSTWRVASAAEESTALRRFQVSQLDAVIADGSLPGLSQESLLRQASVLRPAAFRLALSGNYNHGAMLRTMGIAHQNLWKPCGLNDIRSALARAFALRETLRNDRLQLLIAQTGTLPSLPRLYLDFLDEVRRQNPSYGRLSDIIRQDISLCSKMLQLVNSAFFGLPKKIDSPEEGLRYLGLEHVRTLVLSIQVFSLFDMVQVKQFSLETLWDHSWKVGALARTITTFERRPADEIETAFTAGILHDLGNLVLMNGIPRSWQESLEIASLHSLPLWQVEREKLGASHAEVGAALLAIWGLSDQLVEAIAFHHEPDSSALTSFSPLTAVHAANLLAYYPAAAIASPYLQAVVAPENFAAWQHLASDSAC